MGYIKGRKPPPPQGKNPLIHLESSDIETDHRYQKPFQNPPITQSYCNKLRHRVVKRATKHSKYHNEETPANTARPKGRRRSYDRI